ncbi:MAG: flagellar hook-basal body complex protein FliE [Pseudomonadales bacterium]|jgi:flagellar hook-basal body complex protein FliE|nr:flagellar hook-basal body complex protein FliE [Pseudomonadales bacterium]
MNGTGNVAINDVLARMRALSAELDAPAADAGAARETSGFSELLQRSLSEVNAAQQHSGDMARAFTLGEEANVAEVMVAAQQASLSFEAMNQVRSRLVTAYREIMNMQI